MMNDDIDNFRDYTLRLEILECAKLSAEDVDTLVEIEHRIKMLSEERSEIALRMFQEQQL